MTMFDEDVIEGAQRVLARCRALKFKLATAESLTGGLIAGAVTSIAGASDVLDRAYVVYSYEAKAQMLAVPYELTASCGAVSEAVARAMAQGALARSHPCAQVSVAVTGVAGPGPSGANPAGRVHLASARSDRRESVHRQCDFGDIGREKIRRETILAAFELVLVCLA